MEGEVTLRDLVDQVKEELKKGTDNPDAPLFFVEKVEIQVSVKAVKKATGGVSLQVVNIGGDVSKENTNTITVKLTPIIPVEQLRELLEAQEMIEVRRQSRLLPQGGGIRIA